MHQVILKMESKKMTLLIGNVLKTTLLVLSFIALAVLISTTASMSALRALQIDAELNPRGTKLWRNPINPGIRRKGICVDSNVIAPQGLGDIVLRLRPALIIGEILGASINSPKVETDHGYSTTEMLGLEPCDPAPVFR
jgi:hypothetical protein